MYSYMEWDGLKPKKWKDKGRKKFEQPALEIITPRDSQLIEKPISKHFLPSIQPLSQSICKQSLNNQESSRLDRFYSEPHFRQQFEPIDRQIYYEKKHLRQEKDAHFEDLIQGIKTYELANKQTQGGYIVEDEMQRKVRVSDLRNGIGTHFLGDKPYHVPEYSTNFYKFPDGVIPAILQKLGNQPTDISKIKQVLQKDYMSRTDQDFAQIIEYMSCFQYFEKIKAKYNIEFMKQLCKQLYLRTFAPNLDIPVNRTTYIILSGRVLVTQELDAQKPKTFTDISDCNNYTQTTEMTFGSSFNEFGLQDVQKSTAKTIRMTDLACIDFKVIIELNSNIRSTESNEKQLFLKSISYFSQFSENEIKYLAYKLEVIKPQKNETIYQQDDTNCEWIYFVFKGEFILLKNDDSKQYQITRLIEGEIFGEEGFLKYETRQFSVKSLGDSSAIFRISMVDIEKKVWQRESRKILFNLIGQKWMYRIQRFIQISKQSIDIKETQTHINNLDELSLCTLNLDLEKLLQEQGQENVEEENLDQPRNKILFSASAILRNQQQAQKILQNLKQCKKRQKIQQSISTDQLSVTKLADNYPKTAGPQQRRKLLKRIVDPNIKPTKISSNQNFFPSSNKESLESKLEVYVQQTTIKDEDIDWGGDCSTRRREKKEEFYNNLGVYAQHIKYQNQNFVEQHSNHTKKLNQEYDLLVLQQQQNIKNIFAVESRHKTDNMLRKEYFLKQLKKMQKRLQVLQLIAKGYLTCKYNQYVNDEGEIVDIVEKLCEDDAYEIVDGQKQLRFNFVKSAHYKPNQKPKFKDFNEQILEQKEKIKVISEIVAGNIDPEQVPFINDEYSKQLSIRKKLSDTVQTPALIKSFSQKLRIGSATFKNRNDMNAGYFGNAIKMRKLT